MDIRQTYQDFFTQYGQPSEEANKELRIWLRRPDALDKIEDVSDLKKIDKKDSLKVDNNLGRKIYKFRNRFLTIQYEIPPNPIIHKTT